MKTTYFRAPFYHRWSTEYGLVLHLGK